MLCASDNLANNAMGNDVRVFRFTWAALPAFLPAAEFGVTPSGAGLGWCANAAEQRSGVNVELVMTMRAFNFHTPTAYTNRSLFFMKFFKVAHYPALAPHSYNSACSLGSIQKS